MNNNILKKITFLIILLLIISIVIIMAILYISKINIENEYDYGEVYGEDFTENYGKSENGGVDIQAYSDIKVCMTKYLNSINMKSFQYGSYDENENFVITYPENEIKQKIYNLLSQKYIEQKNITIENIYEHVNVIQESAEFVPLEISMIQDSDIKSFAVYGLIESSEEYELIDKMFTVVNIDFLENRFSIEPIKGNYKNISEIQMLELEKTVEKNKDNQFISEYITATEIPDEYINLYKRITLGEPEKMYALLDEQYRNAKFGSLDNFKTYVNENRNKIKLINIDKYKTIIKDDYIQYICIDTEGMYYIFDEKVVLQDYSVMLDAYTIGLPEFTEQYNNSSAKQKAVMNVEKLITAINAKDYAYVYSKLDNTFKNNKFPAEKDLENFIKNNLFEINSLNDVEISEEANLYVCKVKIIDEENQDVQEKTINIIMQLGSATDYTISINI